jgi:hypothetical protein
VDCVSFVVCVCVCVCVVGGDGCFCSPRVPSIVSFLLRTTITVHLSLSLHLPTTVGNALSVRLETSVQPTAQPWTVAVEVRNPYSETVAVLRRNCPLSMYMDHPSSLRVYDVTEGREVAYDGPIYKRTAVPSDEEYAVVAPGASVRVEVDLSRAYNFVASHQYTVSVGRQAKSSAFRLTDALLQKRTRDQSSLSSLMAEVGDESATFGSVSSEAAAHTFTAATNSVHPHEQRSHVSTRAVPGFADCSLTEQATILTAVGFVNSGLISVNSYFSGGCRDSQYTRFFGDITNSRYVNPTCSLSLILLHTHTHTHTVLSLERRSRFVPRLLCLHMLRARVREYLHAFVCFSLLTQLREGDRQLQSDHQRTSIGLCV